MLIETSSLSQIQNNNDNRNAFHYSYILQAHKYAKKMNAPFSESSELSDSLINSQIQQLERKNEDKIWQQWHHRFRHFQRLIFSCTFYKTDIYYYIYIYIEKNFITKKWMIRRIYQKCIKSRIQINLLFDRSIDLPSIYQFKSSMMARLCGQQMKRCEKVQAVSALIGLESI